MSTPDPILHLRLRLPLERFALELDLALRTRVTGIFGPSGAGKTSLLETIAGLRRGAQGRIQFQDTVWLDTDGRIFLPPEARGIGYVPQDHGLFPHHTVRGNLLAGSRRAARRGLSCDAVLDPVVAALELAPLLERPVDALSGGERQRVALGRALCSGPDLLLLDEPLAALDLGLRQRVLPYLRRVREQFDLPMLIVSHQPTELQALCDEIVVLHEGRITATGSPATVFTRPDIFPLAEQAGYTNLLPARLTAHRPHASEVALGPDGEGPTVCIPRFAAAPGERVLLSLAATDLLLATAPPVGLSARNALPARLLRIAPLEHLQLAVLELIPSLPPIVLEMTAEAIEELRLVPDNAVFVVFKSSAARALPFS